MSRIGCTQMLGESADVLNFFTGLIQAGADVTSDITDVKQAEIARDTAMILAPANTGATASGVRAGIDPGLLIGGGIAVVGVLVLVFVMARK